jgi:hypothetical protein
VLWLPTSVDKGCPNFLRQGLKAPAVTVPIERIDEPGYPEGEDYPASEPWTLFKYEQRPTGWQLLWEDRRYLDGTIPAEETEYLDDRHAKFPNAVVNPVPPPA